MSSTDHKAPHYTGVSSLVLLPPSSALISSSKPYTCKIIHFIKMFRHQNKFQITHNFLCKASGQSIFMPAAGHVHCKTLTVHFSVSRQSCTGLSYILDCLGWPALCLWPVLFLFCYPTCQRQPTWHFHRGPLHSLSPEEQMHKLRMKHQTKHFPI